MLKVGLTGGVACGKSTVGEMFVRLGARLAKADEIAHELMSHGARAASRDPWRGPSDGHGNFCRRRC